MKNTWPIAVVDTETTGRNPRRHMAWEIAVITRGLSGAETRRLWQVRPTDAELRAAEDEALDISRFRERFAVPAGAEAADMTPILPGGDGNPVPLTRLDVANQIFETLFGTVLHANNAHFDASFLHALLRRDLPPWHYRPVCVIGFAAGVLHGRHQAGALAHSDVPGTPFDTRAVARAFGVEPLAADEMHTALADAEWALAVYDAATEYPRSRLAQNPENEAASA